MKALRIWHHTFTYNYKLSHISLSRLQKLRAMWFSLRWTKTNATSVTKYPWLYNTDTSLIRTLVSKLVQKEWKFICKNNCIALRCCIVLTYCIASNSYSLGIQLIERTLSGETYKSQMIRPKMVFWKVEKTSCVLCR